MLAGHLSGGLITADFAIEGGDENSLRQIFNGGVKNGLPRRILASTGDRRRSNIEWARQSLCPPNLRLVETAYWTVRMRKVVSKNPLATIRQDHIRAGVMRGSVWVGGTDPWNRVGCQVGGVQAGCRVDHTRASRYTSTSTSGSSSVVECFLAKEDVAGSTPVSRSNQRLSALHFCSTRVGSSHPFERAKPE